MRDKRYDLAVLGVTGYTGELVLRYLSELPEAERGRVLLAGRTPDKVRTLCSRLGVADYPVLAADTGDASSLRALAQSTRTLINLAGPYADHGPAVVAACVEAGANYLDLTGEPHFVRGMIDRHHESARAAGLRILHCSGFESLPFDFTTLSAVSRLRERHDEACQRVELSIEMLIRDPAVKRDAALSGGTTATILQLLQTGGPELLDPALLLPEGSGAEAARARHPMPRSAMRDPLTDSWATPVLPAPTLNPQVILRSAALYAEAGSPYGDDFTYREMSSLRGLVPRPLQRAAATAAAKAVAHGMDVLSSGPAWERNAMAKAVRKVGAASGQGPRHDLLDKFDYTLRARATSATGRTADARFEAKGSPGYLSTAKMLVQAGLALSFDGLRLPAIHGVLTPAAALGLSFSARLPAASIQLSLD